MKHQFTCILLLFFLSANYGIAQKVRAIETNPDFKKVRICEKFDYLHDDWQEDSIQWVCDLRVSLDTLMPGTIRKIFGQFWKRANQLGANSFRLNNSDIYVHGRDKFIELKCYWLRQEYRNQNLKKFRSTDVYLFGFLAHHVQIQGYEVTFNEEDFLIQELTYHRFGCEEGETVQISIGGKSRGDLIELKIKNDQTPRYYYFSEAKGSFQNAWISTHEQEFARFLVQILDQA